MTENAMVHRRVSLKKTNNKTKSKFLNLVEERNDLAIVYFVAVSSVRCTLSASEFEAFGLEFKMSQPSRKMGG